MVPAGYRTNRRVAIIAIALIIALAGALTFALFPSIWAVQSAVFDYDQSTGPDRGVNLAEVADHPNVMWGRTVTISAEVTKILNPQAMIIGHETLFITEHVLILAPVGLSRLLAESEPGSAIDTGDVARVTGAVRQFEPAGLAQELGLEPAGQDFEGYEGNSVLIADSIELNPPRAVGPGDKEFTSGTDGYEIGITAFDLTHGVEGEYIGKVVTVSGEVEHVFAGHHALSLSDHKLLAVSAEPRPEAFVEATAYVTGTVRRFDLAEIEAEMEVNLDDEAFRDYEGKVVVVADVVEIIA